MLDRYVGIVGLILGIISFIAPYRWPDLSPILTTAGLYVALLLAGAAIGMFYSDHFGASPTPQRPEFHVTVSGGNIFIPDQMPGATGIGLDVRIWNTGAPSIVTNWTLRVTPNGAAPVQAQLTAMPNALSATGPFNSSRLLASNSLETKTRDTPVDITPISGVLLFYV